MLSPGLLIIVALQRKRKGKGILVVVCFLPLCKPHQAHDSLHVQLSLISPLLLPPPQQLLLSYAPLSR